MQSSNGFCFRKQKEQQDKKILEMQRTKAAYMFRVVNGVAPACLTDLFTRKQDVTNYSLRGSSTSLQLPLPKTESGKKIFSYDGAKVSNSIPENLRNCKSVSSLRLKWPLTPYFNELNFYSKFLDYLIYYIEIFLQIINQCSMILVFF